MKALKLLFVLALAMSAVAAVAAPRGVRLKDLARIDGVRDNPLVGYGLVIGLSGSGDTPRMRATTQSVMNTLANFGVNVSEQDISSRNVAAVMVTATLPAFANSGDKLDVHVSSIGDARSLTGGTLLLAPLYGPDQKLYALAQGPLAVGGYKFKSFGNMVQLNQPTVGIVPGGATVERGAGDPLSDSASRLSVLLDNPDFITAKRIVTALRAKMPTLRVHAKNAGKITIRLPSPAIDLVSVIARIQNVVVVPDQPARVVVNERSGTVVAGGDVRISNVSIVHDSLRVTISTRFQVSQPSMVAFTGDGVRSVVVPDTDIDVANKLSPVVSLPAGTTIAELVSALHHIHLGTRDIITIWQSIKRAGALHAQLIIQ
ncbi:MAG TPA: flagellar basal body P-ring protein FlgI [Gammaproteobacteria bacterium]|nr:flagellar basal body P-ring protein FlgI [Gammaproteobacteria bacterium]